MEHIKLDPAEPMSVDPLTPGDLLTEYRWKHVQAMQRAKEVIDRIDSEFAALFGRGYGGLVDTYRAGDAEFLLVTMGSVTGTARVAIDLAREEGIPAGLLKIRALRPSLTRKWPRPRKASG